MNEKYRNYRRVWIKGHYRKRNLITYENGKEIKVRVKTWVEKHWRKIKIKEKEITKEEFLKKKAKLEKEFDKAASGLSSLL